ncbi:MAG: hypothetical protein ABIO78_06675, partial [Thermoanaerobaculia bacterium]
MKREVSVEGRERPIVRRFVPGVAAQGVGNGSHHRFDVAESGVDLVRNFSRFRERALRRERLLIQEMASRDHPDQQQERENAGEHQEDEPPPESDRDGAGKLIHYIQEALG